MKRKLSIAFKPTNQCNLQCTYCYAENLKSLNSKTMTLSEAKDVFDWVLKYCKDFNLESVFVYWHGGEPLLPGVVFMKNCIEYYMNLFLKNNISCENIIQTNVLLLTADYYPIIHQYFRSGIGTSYDFKSLTRMYPNGKDASDEILARIIKLQKEGFSVAAISMLHSGNIAYIPELYQFFNKNKIDLILNRIIPPLHGSACATQIALSTSWQSYAEAMCQIFDIWYNDKESKIQIAPLRTIFKSYLTEETRNCNFRFPDGTYYTSIGPGGEIYPCARFDGRESMLGTIYKQSPAEIVQKRQKMNETCETNEQLGCDRCECYGSLCLGGCFHSRVIGWQREECNAYRAIWKHMKEVLEKDGLCQGCMKKQV